MPAFAAVHLCSCLVALPAATHPLMIAVPTAQPNLAQIKETFAKECANSQCFKVVAAPSKAAAAGKPTAAAQAAADQPADGVAGDGKAEAKPAADQAAGGLRNVDHREFLNLCHNWQKASAGLRIEGGQRWAVPAYALQFASFAHCPMRVLSMFQRRHPCPGALSPSLPAEADGRGVQQLPAERRLHAGQERAAGAQPLCAGAWPLGWAEWCPCPVCTPDAAASVSAELQWFTRLNPQHGFKPLYALVPAPTGVPRHQAGCHQAD